MKPRGILLVLGVTLLGRQAAAEVPYGQLEKLRRQSIVVRVALDTPDSGKLKKCQGGQNFATLGGDLSLAMDTAAEDWRKLTLKEEDLPRLKSKVRACKERGSCQIYEAFLSSVKVSDPVKAEADELRKYLSSVLEKLESKSYEKAWESISAPCEVLQQLKK